MDFEDVIVKESPGVCRCCLSEGCYKDLGSEYLWMEETEVYADMLLECFDISISQHSDGPNGMSRLICEVCVTRLRDACNFKKQVLQSEKRFIDMVARGDFENKDTACEDNIKLDHNEEPMDSADVDYFDEGIDFDGGNNESEEIAVEPIKIRSKPGRPKRNAKVDKKSNEATPSASKTVAKDTTAEGPYENFASVRRRKNMEILFNNTSIIPFKWRSRYMCFYCSKEYSLYPDFRKHTKGHGLCTKSDHSLKIIKGSNIEIKLDISEINYCVRKRRRIFRREMPQEHKELYTIRNNVTAVLLRTTLLPFRWLRTCFRCFYCYEMFDVVDKLRSHQIKHTENDVERAMGMYWEKTVYVDTSDAFCKICDKNIDNLHALVYHLVSEHSLAFDQSVGLGMTPFNLTISHCIICGLTVKNFPALLVHMADQHSKLNNLYCDLCKVKYRSFNDYCVHIKKEKREVECVECNQRVRTDSYNEHMKVVHEKNYKCLTCAEYFKTTYQRSLHMSSVHRRKCLRKCPHCPRMFVFPSNMSRHVRESHYNEKNAMCHVCGFKTFSGHRLKVHMTKHNSSKKYICPFCNKLFKTEKYMRDHCAKSHTK
ncbi:zinc finger protein 26-like isoform X5 [Leptidea sinapis]|nr:zinc finger protein 26-like isoform X5 [Leptidea sinapis]